jgi:sRNA-binding carbon storage regulator CsrA
MKSKEAPKKVSILRERVQKALWFAKSFGVQLTEIKGADKNGKIYERKTKH